VTVVGGVFSQAEEFTSLNNLWIGLAFHAVATALGTGMLSKSLGSRHAALTGTLPEKP
jgi:hypothetical protein